MKNPKIAVITLASPGIGEKLSKLLFKNNLDISELAKYSLNINNLSLEASESQIYFVG